MDEAPWHLRLTLQFVCVACHSCNSASKLPVIGSIYWQGTYSHPLFFLLDQWSLLKTKNGERVVNFGLELKCSIRFSHAQPVQKNPSAAFV